MPSGPQPAKPATRPEHFEPLLEMMGISFAGAVARACAKARWQPHRPPTHGRKQDTGKKGGVGGTQKAAVIAINGRQRNATLVQSHQSPPRRAMRETTGRWGQRQARRTRGARQQGVHEHPCLAKKCEGLGTRPYAICTMECWHAVAT